MGNKDIEEVYPHWKDAILNHRAFINLRCAAHYVLWNIMYGALAAGTLIKSKLKSVGGAIGSRVPTIQMPENKFASRVGGVAKSDKLWEALSWVPFVVLATLILHGLVTQFWAMMTTFAILAGMIVIALVSVAVAIAVGGFVATAIDSSNDKLRAVGEKAAETPGIRRVYGKCPVDMDSPPKWFNERFSENE